MVSGSNLKRTRTKGLVLMFYQFIAILWYAMNLQPKNGIWHTDKKEQEF